MIKLVIFDLDGTLLNSVEDLGNSCNYILEKHNFPIHPMDKYNYFVGNGVAKLVERALPEEHRSPKFVEQIRKEFIAYYSLHAQDKTSPYPGIIELLNGLQKRNIKLAVASNKFDTGTKSLVAQYFGDMEFAAVYGQREGISPKPDPSIIYDILKDVHISDKSEVLYLGDTGTDMQTCNNSGLTSVGVLWGFRPKEELELHGAKYLISHPMELLEIIDNFS